MARSKHALTISRHTRMMVGLGFKGGIRNHTTYLRKLAYSKKWNKLHHADINAAKNILSRFITGPYGAGFKPEMVEA
ncbi:hypothetical protein LCGC14_2137520 [marine sediment metagenome]|uniref:Uncharacterized protein n=1 Tax=marine sediment metagenome TaxID=412755 RepID=A0A0F9ELN2_9ZZZZ